MKTRKLLVLALSLLVTLASVSACVVAPGGARYNRGGENYGYAGNNNFHGGGFYNQQNYGRPVWRR